MSDATSNTGRRQGDRKHSTVSSVVEAIRDAIADGRIGPGYRLVQEELCRQFGVGRGTLREALQRLESEDWVDFAHNRGAHVRVLTRTEIIENAQVREALEMTAAGLAARNVTPDSAAALEALMARLNDAMTRRDKQTYLVENNNFHEFIVQLSGNKRLMEMNDLKLTKLIQAQMEKANGDDWMPVSQAEHEAIAAAIAGRDAPGAERAMRGHIARVNEILMTLPEHAFRPMSIAPKL